MMAKRTDRWATHFWTLRREPYSDNSPVLIALPRNPHTLKVMGMPEVDFERTMIISECAIPETLVVALPGRTATDVIDHAFFHAGARGEGAVITWAMIDAFGLKLVFDRPVQPDAMPAGFEHSLIPRA